MIKICCDTKQPLDGMSQIDKLSCGHDHCTGPVETVNKHFVFKDDSYWSSNGCDCCDDVFMSCYNSDDIDPALGSAHCIEDCYAQALITFKGYDNLSSDHMSEIYYLPLEELMADCEQYGLTVEFEP